MMVFELVRAHYGQRGGFFSFLRPAGDGVLSRAAGVLFSLYSLVLLFLAFLSLFRIPFFPDGAFLPVYLLLMYASLFFITASFARGLFDTDKVLEMLRSFPIDDRILFASRFFEMMADTFFPSVAAFLPLVSGSSGTWRLPLLPVLFFFAWSGSSLLTAFLAMRTKKRLFIGLVAADAVFIPSFFLFSAFGLDGGRTVVTVTGIIPCTAVCALVFLMLLHGSAKAFGNRPDVGAKGGFGVHEPRIRKTMGTLFMRQAWELAADGALVVKLVAWAAMPVVILLAAFHTLDGRMDALTATCALALISSNAPLPASSYSRDAALRSLLAPLPVSWRTDLVSRMLFHFVLSSLPVAAYAFVMAMSFGRDMLLSVASCIYPVVHSLASGATALVTDLERVERRKGEGMFFEHESGFTALKPFLLSVLLEIVSISVAVAIGLENASLLLFCSLFETAFGLLLLLKAGRGRK